MDDNWSGGSYFSLLFWPILRMTSGLAQSLFRHGGLSTKTIANYTFWKFILKYYTELYGFPRHIAISATYFEMIALFTLLALYLLYFISQ